MPSEIVNYANLCYVLNQVFFFFFFNQNLNNIPAQAGIKIAKRNINNLRYAHVTIIMAESEEELKSLLMKMKEESEKVG